MFEWGPTRSLLLADVDRGSASWHGYNDLFTAMRSRGDVVPDIHHRRRDGVNIAGRHSCYALESIFVGCPHGAAKAERAAMAGGMMFLIVDATASACVADRVSGLSCV